MRKFNEQISTATPLNSNVNTRYSPLKGVFMYCISAIATGTPTGTIRLQASNDPETNDTQYNTTNNLPPSVVPTNWVDIADSDFALTAAGTTLWNVRDVGYNYVRVAYTDGSGGTSAATMRVTFTGSVA